LLLNKSVMKTIQIVFLFIFIISCSDKESKIPVLDFQNKSQLLEVVKKHYDKNSSVAFGGVFDESGKRTIVTGSEIENNKDWGIKFTQLEIVDDEFKVKFETNLLDGSFKQSFVDKIKFASFDNELIYYNSQDYYLGSGGGEIFSYIIDFTAKQVYFAHLIIEPSTSISLFISGNTKSKELRNFFVLTFKKDYPDLKVVDKDVSVD
jgi:hypothetical protein